MSQELNELKTQKEIEKLHLEAEKLILEKKELKKGNWKFFLGSILVPLLVAGTTIFLVITSKIFDDTAIHIQNEKDKFEKEKIGIADSIAGMKDSLKTMWDYLRKVKDSASKWQDQNKALQSSNKYLQDAGNKLRDALSEKEPFLRKLIEENAGFRQGNSLLSLENKRLHDTLSMHNMSTDKLENYVYGKKFCTY